MNELIEFIMNGSTANIITPDMLCRLIVVMLMFELFGSVFSIIGQFGKAAK